MNNKFETFVVVWVMFLLACLTVAVTVGIIVSVQ